MVAMWIAMIYGIPFPVGNESIICLIMPSCHDHFPWCFFELGDFGGKLNNVSVDRIRMLSELF